MTTILPGPATPVAVLNQGANGPALGFQQIADLSVAVHLNPPAGATMALIAPEGQAVRWRDDGTAPTAAIGMPIAPTIIQPYVYSGNLAAIQFIQQAASATLSVTYY